jgi:hypothetical protein
MGHHGQRQPKQHGTPLTWNQKQQQQQSTKRGHERSAMVNGNGKGNGSSPWSAKRKMKDA